MRRAAELLVSAAAIPGGFFLIQELQGADSATPFSLPDDAETHAQYDQGNLALPSPTFASAEQIGSAKASELLMPEIPDPIGAAETASKLRWPSPEPHSASASLSARAPEVAIATSDTTGQPQAAKAQLQLASAEFSQVPRSNNGDQVMVAVDPVAVITDPHPSEPVQQNVSSINAQSGTKMTPLAALVADVPSSTDVDLLPDILTDQAPPTDPKSVTAPTPVKADTSAAVVSPSSSFSDMVPEAPTKALPETISTEPSDFGGALDAASVKHPGTEVTRSSSGLVAPSRPGDAYLHDAVFHVAPVARDIGSISGAKRPVVETTSAKLVEIPVTSSNSRPMPSPLFGLEKTAIPLAEPQASLGPKSAPGEQGPLRVSTLADAIAASYARNPRLLSERAVLRAADFALPAARSAYGPELDVTASLAFARNRDEILPGTMTSNQGFTNTASLVLSQPLLTFGRSAAAVGAAQATIAYRREALRVVQNEVLLQVISSYAGVIREAGAVTIARENVSLLEKELADARTRYAERDITLTDVQQVESRLSLGRTYLLDAKARLSAQQGTFYSAVGMAPGDLSAPETMLLPVSSLEEAYGLADLHNPLLQAARMRERISRAHVAQAKAETRPTLSLKGSADYGTLLDYGNNLRTQRLRGQLTIAMPLLDGGKRSAEIGRAEEANDSDWQLLDAAGRETRAEVAARWTKLQAASGSVEFSRKSLQASLSAYEGAKEQERAGFRTTLELLDLARDLLDARNRYNAALAEEYVARANLLSTMGALDPETLSPSLRSYDPEIHLTKVTKQSSIPLLNGLLSGIDQVWAPDLATSRPSRDPAAHSGIGEIDVTE
ncbi:Type I secretion outer membrane protein, TolC [Novosphingobium subterraneum]|uniref:Type I secretion outer membrane protein, TolC n=2 Tax=Sphingomonadaceae TaxID=41297 RepID=A0A0B8Z6B7_9SPHN|nr:Type I secretion outer membrane protein, TolC [Novosphingobium subterraneum]